MEEPKSENSATRLPFQSPFFYGWIIVGLSALTLFFSGPGQTYSVSVFIDSYITEFSWSRSVISSMYSMGTLLAGLIMGVMGNLFDRCGHRVMTTAIAVFLGLACLWMSFVHSVLMIFSGFFIIRLLGQGSMSLSGTTLTPQWFVKKRGRALSFVFLGGAISSALLPPFNTWLIQTYGWRFAWRIWTALLWCIMVPIAYLLTRDRPEDVGLLPDDQEVMDEVSATADMAIEEDSWTVREAMRKRSFWLLLFCMMVPSAIVTGLIFHQVSIMGRVGLSPEVAALVLSTMALVRLPFVFIAGQIADRMPVRYLQAVSLGGLAVCMIVLLNANSVELALAYGVLLGVMMAFQRIVSGVVWPDYFGRRNLSSIRGVTLMAGVIGSAFGPLPFGFGYDLFGGYGQILIMSLVFPVLGVVAALLAVPPGKLE